MAGTVTCGTISDGTNSTSSTNCIQGSAKAWASYNASTKTVNASYNCSSITWNSTSSYTFNFTNALSDTNYAIVGTVGGASNNYFLAPWGGVKSTTQFGMTINTSVDPTSVSMAIFR